MKDTDINWGYWSEAIQAAYTGRPPLDLWNDEGMEMPAFACWSIDRDV